MAKKLCNYEAFVNNKNRLEEIRRRQNRRHRMKILFAVVILLGILLVLYILQGSRCDYYVYKDQIKTEENNGVEYEPFRKGYIKYSSNGIEYQKQFGTAQWNVSISFSQPFLAMSENYGLIGDKGGNKLLLFNEKGIVQSYKMKYPIVQCDVSNQGIIEVILEGEESNFIQVYDNKENLIADMKSSVDETGYPVTAAISPDGTQLAVSYYAIDSMHGTTRITFYDFSQQVQADSITLKGGFDYKDTLIPRMDFFTDNLIAVYGNNKTYYYNIEDEPKEIKAISFDEPIESIFVNGSYSGYVCANNNQEEGQYRLYLYDSKGRKKMSTALDMNYDSIRLVNKEIIATKNNECTILNMKGKILFQGELEGSNIETVLPVKGWRTYQIVFGDKIVKMKLQFWQSSN